MHIGCTLPLYLCFVNEPKGLRQVNPKFNFCVMNEQKKVFGDFEIILRYEDCDNLKNHHKYFVECLDTQHSVKMVIDSRVIEKTSRLCMEGAVEQVKEYFRCRLNHHAWWDNFARP